MRRTIEEHIDNLLAKLPELAEKMTGAAADAITASVKAKCAAGKQPMPQTIVVTEEQCAKVVRNQLRGIVEMVTAIMDLELQDAKRRNRSA